MASANVTVTAKSGPAVTLTAGVFTNARSLSFDFSEQTVTVVDDGGGIHCFDLFGVATITYTISGHVGTVALS